MEARGEPSESDSSSALAPLAYRSLKQRRSSYRAAMYASTMPRPEERTCTQDARGPQTHGPFSGSNFPTPMRDSASLGVCRGLICKELSAPVTSART